jgi:ATP-dependent DNA helicase RecG
VVNAIMHRDYRFTGARVMVQMFPDRVEVSNPGGLPPGLDRRSFGSKSVHRNELIADLLYRLEVGERVGSGIRRMRASMRAAGLPPPTFQFDSFFTAAFRKKAPRVPTLDPIGTKSGLSRDQVKILELCGTPRPLTDILATFGRTNRTKFRTGVLDPLLQAGLLAPTIPEKPRSRFQKYVTTEAGRKQLKGARP